MGCLCTLLLVLGCTERNSSPQWRIALPDDSEGVASTSQPARVVRSTNPLRGEAHMVDRLVMIDSAEGFAAGELKFVKVVSDSPARIVLDDTRERTYPRYGTWTSPEVATDFPFTELLPSWNASTPQNTGVIFEVRAREAASGVWTPWLYIGRWGRVLDNDKRVVTCDWGTVHVDNLVLDKPADAYQIRARLESFDLDASVNPSIRRIAVAYSGRVDDDQRRAQLVTQPVIDDTAWARDLDVPFRAQGVAPQNIRSSICSPTSTTMVMAYAGVDRPTIENAMAIYDDEHDIFGNWNRATQRAGELGLDAWLTRFRNWDQVKAMIAQGTPVVAAIKFETGQFPSALYQETDGHLIVIRGFTPEGNVIVNDPASKDKGERVIYQADELAIAWFTNAGGVGYVIRKPRG